MMEHDDERTQMRYAQALADWGDAGGYEAETLWDICTVAALGLAVRTGAVPRGPHAVRRRAEAARAGGAAARPGRGAAARRAGQLPRRAGQALARGAAARVAQDRALRLPRPRAAGPHGDPDRHARAGAAGVDAWTHGGGFASYAQAREDRHCRLEELRRRWDEEHAKLKALVLMYKAEGGVQRRHGRRATRRRRPGWRKFEEAGPPQALPREQDVKMRLRGGRTGKRAVICEQLELTGLMQPFDLEVWFGDRVAVLGSNGSGKSHFLRLLAAGGTDPDVGAPAGGRRRRSRRSPHTGVARLGARVRPGLVRADPRAPRPDRPHAARDPAARRRAPRRHGPRAGGRGRSTATSWRRPGEQRFETLSGGQQARFQILLLELSGATLLLLDEPTDNLDLASAEALEEGLDAFEGTVLAVTHDRWFARSFDRFLRLRRRRRGRRVRRAGLGRGPSGADPVRKR